jgi:hypothetical protein
MRLMAVCACFLMLLCSCSRIPSTPGYQSMYAHLEQVQEDKRPFCESERFLVVLVDARHLDYTDNRSFLKTVAKHPDDGSKGSDVGHAWIYLQGKCGGKVYCLEGGHSGESGLLQARYFDGIMNNIDYGYANPAKEEMECPRYEPNPIKYLWESQHDGFFQYGAGGHRPTYAAKMDLTEEQYYAILTFIQHFDFSDYSLRGNQCSSFAAQVASIGGLELEYEVDLTIDPVLQLGGYDLVLWNDPCYAKLTVSSPDIIEKDLMQAVGEGRAEYALDWYLHTHPEPVCRIVKKWRTNIVRFPKRLCRYWYICS